MSVFLRDDKRDEMYKESIKNNKATKKGTMQWPQRLKRQIHNTIIKVTYLKDEPHTKERGLIFQLRESLSYR